MRFFVKKQRQAARRSNTNTNLLAVIIQDANARFADYQKALEGKCTFDTETKIFHAIYSNDASRFNEYDEEVADILIRAFRQINGARAGISVTTGCHRSLCW